MKYRPEIDGLRAAAVLSVIFYHIGLNVGGIELFKGGFLGVDVFFVISGYLISGILLQQFSEGNFTFKNFYERRARRILPMLFTVMFASIPFALIYMFPSPLVAYVKSIFSSVLFSSNFLFWSEGGYTLAPNALKPFLHTWSLSLEEQFYIFFPIVLLLCWKYARRYLTPLLIFGFFLSLGLAEWASRKHTVLDFYSLPTRSWELIAGAFLARIENKNRPNRFAPWLSSLGLAAILISVFVLDDQIRHPSLLTLTPVLGTMLIIYFRGEKYNILSTKLLVSTGLISYSLYLWHQPVFAFARMASIDSLNVGDKAGLLLVTFLLSIGSWKFIERPFRDKAKLPFKKLVIMLSTAAIILLGFSAAVYFTKGLAGRFQFPIISELDKIQKDLLISVDGKGCHERDISEACKLGDEQAAEKWIITGDSHMGYLSTLLWDRLKGRNVSLTILTKGGCPYAPGLVLGKGEADHPCSYETNLKRRDFLLKAPPSIIVIGGRLPYYLSGDRFDNHEGGIELQQGNFTYGLSPKSKKIPPSEWQKFVKDSLDHSIRELLAAGHKVVLVYPVPEVGWDPLETIKKHLITQIDEKFQQWMQSGGVTTSHKVFEARAKEAYAVYDALGEDAHLYRVYPSRFFCDTAIKGRCMTHDQKNIYYADQDHLSKLGNDMVAAEIIKQLEEK